MNPADAVVSGRDGDNPPERPVDPVPGVPGAAAGGWLTRPASPGRVGSLGRRDRASHARPDGDRLRAAAGRLVARLRRAHARRRRPAEPGARPLVARPRRHRLDCLRRAAATAPVIGAVVLTWWLGAYALAFGVALLVLAFRLRARKDDTRRTAARSRRDHAGQTGRVRRHKAWRTGLYLVGSRRSLSTGRRNCAGQNARRLADADHLRTFRTDRFARYLRC